ncbi:M48 family metalloprotease, partial [Alphaproteobacteria bacterium]|nr:M48 family metalloprotease [Alphaproteobacteria bacterium]
NKKISYKIINDNFPNAFVNENNILFLSSGLFIYSPDYVSLLAVLAHEIGHLEKYHVTKRKNEIKDLKKINSLGNLVAIAGSMIMQNPELINAIAVNEIAINNFYISFSKDQEIEADVYAAETLNKLKLPNKSVKEFLVILENKTKFDLMDDELKKFSTHPLFKERHEILDSKKEENVNLFNKNFQNEFNFIRAKFMAYTDSDYLNNLKNDEKIYYEAIRESLSGNLYESLKKLNLLISKYINNSFIIETKADILLSYGYNKEALNFYKKVLKNNPENNYVKFNIFTNSKIVQENKKLVKDNFYENLNLISLFPYNDELLSKYNNLSKILKYSEWTYFFEIILYKKENLKKELIKLNSNTKDYNLKKIIKLYI